MKKVLFFLESLSGGGAEKVLYDLVSNLNKAQYNISVVSLVDVGVYNEQLKQICNYKAILPALSEKDSLFKKATYKIKYKLIHKLSPKTAYKWFFKENYDTEIAFVEGFSTKIIAASCNPNSKKIAWVHIDLEANHWTKIEYKNLEEEINTYKKFNHIISVAESVQTAFSIKFGINDRLSVKYNPVDRNDIIKKAKEALSITATKKAYRLVTVGRLEEQKGYDRLLEVMLRLKNDTINVELWIIGEGSKRRELETYIQVHQLENHVVLHGFQTNPYKFIAASDAFVCSSRAEGFSTVVTEALILGKPVIATNCSGMTELLGNNEYGLITENNTESLYHELKRFLTDSKLQKHFTLKSEERSIDFDINKTIKSIEELL
ncbi:glycosyltransferase [Yeosuana sp. AK3]